MCPSNGAGVTVVRDNCSIHKGKEIEKAIKDVGAQLIYLPPYSPDFNPIEKLWSKVKNTLRSIAARTYKDLDLVIAEAYSQVSLKDIRNWFATRSLCAAVSLCKAVPLCACEALPEGAAVPFKEIVTCQLMNKHKLAFGFARCYLAILGIFN